MKNLLKVFLGIFILLNLSCFVYADNYSSDNNSGSTKHSVAYEYMMTEKEKAQKKYPEGLGTIILFIVVNILFALPSFIKWNDTSETN